MKFYVEEFGAKGDGITNDQAGIQKAIDVCHENGGGQVVLSGGKVYISGYLILKSHVDFHLENGAVLKASDKIEDYYPLMNGGEIKPHESGLPSFLNSEYAGRPFHAFIYAYDGEDICVSGMGAIDGTEEMFYGHDSGYHIEGSYYPRVPLLLLEKIKNLTVKEVTLKKCAFWTLHMVGCQDVLVDGIRILNNLRMANSDGIDLDHCQNVRIANCHIECGDDAIVLKNSKDYEEYGPTENVVITNCTLISTSAAIKFGTEGESDFRNILVTNCTISNSNRGISIQIRDKGNVENAIFANLTIETRRFSDEWWGRAEPITITCHDRKKGVKSGIIKEVLFQNIICRGENGIFFHGMDENLIEDITIDNVKVILEKNSKWPVEGYDIRPIETGDGKLSGPVYGLYSKNVKGLEVSRLRVQVEENMLLYYGGDKKFE